MNRATTTASSPISVRALIVFVIISAIAVAGSGGQRTAHAATGWQVNVGTSSSDQAIQANGFFAREIWVDQGDTVTWTLKSGEIHTVTFLAGTTRPPLIGPGPAFNPVAVAPSGGPNFDNTAYTNSGLLAVPGTTFSLTFTASGDFDYVCLVHSTMSGVVHVAAPGTAYPHSQAFYDQQAFVQSRQLLAQGAALAGQGRAAADGSGITAGIGALNETTGVADLRFYPGTRIAHVGQTVAWTNMDPETPHTVTFGTEPPGGPLGAFAPSGLDGDGHATVSSTSQSLNSGFLGAGLPFGTQFSITFTSPGTYSYYCALHDDLGMTGTVVVVP